MAAEKTTAKSLPAQAAELWDLVRAYTLQETVEPIKGLSRYAAYGVIGSLLVSLGLLLLILGGLRALQTETGDTFEGNWSWVPYLITLAVTALVIVLVLRGTAKRKAV